MHPRRIGPHIVRRINTPSRALALLFHTCAFYVSAEQTHGNRHAINSPRPARWNMLQYAGQKLTLCSTIYVQQLGRKCNVSLLYRIEVNVYTYIIVFIGCTHSLLCTPPYTLITRCCKCGLGRECIYAQPTARRTNPPPTHLAILYIYM